MDDLDDSVEEVDNSMSSQDETGDEDEVLQFREKFEKLVNQGEVENINVVTLQDNLSSIDDADLLDTAKSVDSRKTSKKLYSERLEQIPASEDGEEEESIIDEAIEEAEEDNDIPEEDVMDGEIEDIIQEAEEEQTQQENDTSQEEDSEDMEEEIELNDTPTPNSDSNEDEDTSEQNEDSNEQMDVEETDLSVDLGGVAENAMTKEEADAQDRRQGIMIWGDPGMGKTHFAYTMPNPVCIIDTEGKSDDISHKFDGTGNGDPFIWQPSDYDGAVQALNEAFEVLERFKQQAGITGTIVVDSMSIMWDWSQQKYVDFAYPTKDDVEEVEFSSSMGRSGESDWKQIKRYHNVKFRQRIIDSPYHFCWTQMRGDDYAAVMEGEAQTPPDKPVGEKENVYKANYIINVREDDDGAPVGNLEKSALTKHNYTGLRYPTFDKHNDILQGLDAIETGNSDKSIRDLEKEFDITLIKGNPSYVQEG